MKYFAEVIKVAIREQFHAELFHINEAIIF